jgi:hypothetical protein
VLCPSNKFVPWCTNWRCYARYYCSRVESVESLQSTPPSPVEKLHTTIHDYSNICLIFGFICLFITSYILQHTNMFGELESESPRVPSPWDPFLASPSSLSVSDLDISSSFVSSPGSNPVIPKGIPKLVPEADQVSFSLQIHDIDRLSFTTLLHLQGER